MLILTAYATFRPWNHYPRISNLCCQNDVLYTRFSNVWLLPLHAQIQHVCTKTTSYHSRSEKDSSQDENKYMVIFAGPRTSVASDLCISKIGRNFDGNNKMLLSNRLTVEIQTFSLSAASLRGVGLHTWKMGEWMAGADHSEPPSPRLDDLCSSLLLRQHHNLVASSTKDTGPMANTSVRSRSSGSNAVSRLCLLIRRM